MGNNKQVYLQIPLPLIEDNIPREDIPSNQPTKKRKPPTKEEAEKEKFVNKYHPVTFYVRPDLLEKFNRISGGIRGQKTKMINEALEEYLNTFEE